MNFDLLSFTVDETETSVRVLSFTGEDGRCWSLLAAGLWMKETHAEWSFDLFWLGHLLNP